MKIRFRKYFDILAFLCILTVAIPVVSRAQTERTVTVDPIQDDAPNDGCTLREAIDLANAGLASALGCTSVETGNGFPLSYRLLLPSYTYVLTQKPGIDDDNTGGDLDVFADVTILGKENATIIDGNMIDRIFHLVLQINTLTLDNLTLRNGRARSDEGGGAIYNAGGKLVITNSTIANNTAPFSSRNGGALFSEGGEVIMEHCTISENTAYHGGGIYLFSADAEIIHSVVTGNSSSDDVGGISLFGGSTVIKHSEVTGNSAIDDAGGISVVGTFHTSIIDTAIANNAALGAGGGIMHYGNLGVRSHI